MVLLNPVEIFLRGCVLRVESHGFLKLFTGRRIFLLLEQHHSQVKMCGAVNRVQIQRRCQVANRLVRPSLQVGERRHVDLKRFQNLVLAPIVPSDLFRTFVGGEPAPLRIRPAFHVVRKKLRQPRRMLRRKRRAVLEITKAGQPENSFKHTPKNQRRQNQCRQMKKPFAPLEVRF